MTFKTFLLRLFPFLSRFFKAPVVTDAPTTDYKAPTSDPVVAPATPVAITPPKPPTNVSDGFSPTPPGYVIPSPPVPAGGPNPIESIPVPTIPQVDRDGTVLQAGDWLWFYPPFRKYTMPVRKVGNYIVEVAGGYQKESVVVKHSDSTEVKAQVFDAGAGSCYFYVDRSDDLIVEVTGSDKGTVRRSDPA